MLATFEIEKEKLIQSFYENSKLKEANIDVGAISVEAVNDADGNFEKLVMKFNLPDKMAQMVAPKAKPKVVKK